MIKADKECIKINGNPDDIMYDFVHVVKAIREVLSNSFGDNAANAILDAFYKISKLTDEEFKEMTKEELDEIVKLVCAGNGR
ncbi:MAG: hypothetical protein SO181_02165 [Frisingicoccus sp.]|uniref:hypothetical protein n=1 Tax=Frisingicoccus sp. TaxID=1918627 RepID=UPI002A8223A9|nr:hypothetical protein [Frisingicoccus sp.]MDY4833943.1 hypothetical protein [Frisingicoccus sp.]